MREFGGGLKGRGIRHKSERHFRSLSSVDKREEHQFGPQNIQNKQLLIRTQRFYIFCREGMENNGGERKKGIHS